MFFATYSHLMSSLILTFTILASLTVMLLVAKILSSTIIKGMPSSFILELPPYRCPQIGKILVRSVMDRTIFVLGRAITVAAPAGLIIWLMANLTVNNASILSYCANFLNPFAKFIGLDGVILTAFILGFPANEIVFPIIIMSYMSAGTIMDLDSFSALKALLLANGWSYKTAICIMIFSLAHFPCGTTFLTIKKETGSLKWAVLSLIIPTITGIVLCLIASKSIDFINFFTNHYKILRT